MYKEAKASMKKIKFIAPIMIGVILVAAVSACVAGCAAGPKAPETLKFGAAIQLSGSVAAAADELQLRDWKLWVEQTNAKGGIYVPEYDKQLPVELILYDDKSDPGTTVKMVEKLMVEDKVDVLLPPWGTAWHYAIAPLVNQYQYPLIGTSCGSTALRASADELPYFFVVERQTTEMEKSLVEVLVEMGVETCAIAYVETQYGIDMWNAIVQPLQDAGIETLLVETYPLEVTDLSPLLKEIKALNPDALLGLSYPADSFLIVEQSKIIDFNPKFMLVAVGAASPVFRDKFGVDLIEGITGHGVWNAHVPYPGASEYFDAYTARWGVEPDRWETYNYAMLQIWEQVISTVGLDREKQREMIATEIFPTMWGNINFVDQYNIDSAGDIGQWQDGEFWPIAPKAKREAMGVQFVYPKPEWPK